MSSSKNRSLDINVDGEFFSPEIRAEIDKWIAKFPIEQKRSAVIAALKIVQKNNKGFLTSNLIAQVACYLNLPEIAVYEVASFYSMFELQPVGKYKISICTNISCLLCGCNKLVENLKTKLKIDFGEVTKDGRFSLKEVECLAACDKSPVIQINERYYENVTSDNPDQILSELD